MAIANVGERIVELREARLVKQQELAKLAGISPSTLSQIESGRVPKPHVSTLRKIARALSVDPQELTAPKVSAPSPGPPETEDEPRLRELGAEALLELCGALDEELERVKASEAEDVKQERIAELRARRDEAIGVLSYAVHRQGPPAGFTEFSAQALERQRRKERRDPEDAGAEAG